MSRMPIACTSRTEKRDAPASAASPSCRTYCCSDASFGAREARPGPPRRRRRSPTVLRAGGGEEALAAPAAARKQRLCSLCCSCVCGGPRDSESSEGGAVAAERSEGGGGAEGGAPADGGASPPPSSPLPLPVAAPAALAFATWNTGCATRTSTVGGTRAAPPWSSRYAATSRSAASPTRTVGFSPGSPSLLPTNPLGLFGARASSSHGLMIAAGCPPSSRKKYVPPSPAGATVGFCHARRPRTTDFASVRTAPRTWAVPTISRRAPLAARAERARSREPAPLPRKAPKGATGGLEEGGPSLPPPPPLLLLAGPSFDELGCGGGRREEQEAPVGGGPALLAFERDEAATETTTGVPSAATPAAAAPPQSATRPRSPETLEGVSASAAARALRRSSSSSSSEQSSGPLRRLERPLRREAGLRPRRRASPGGRKAPSLSAWSLSLSSLQPAASAASPQRNPSAAATAKGDRGCAGIAVSLLLSSSENMVLVLPFKKKGAVGGRGRVFR